MLDINSIRTAGDNIIVRGAHAKIIQSILDFDYMSGKNQPSIKAIISKGKNYGRFFFGNTEILIPMFPAFRDVPQEIARDTNYLLNLSSGRRVIKSSTFAIAHMPKLKGISIFAENVPEAHALELIRIAADKKIWMCGPASVGMLVPGKLKLGAIGGIDNSQILNANLTMPGSAAVLSASGGMTNELINVVAKSGMGLSFSMSFGGERYPIIDPLEAFVAAEADKNTKVIIYFGELGGDDEYKIVEMVRKKKLTKPILSYIAGSVAELFETPPQFGHAKAMASTDAETAKEKRKALREVGVISPDTFDAFLTEIESIAKKPGMKLKKQQVCEINPHRKPTPLASSITSTDQEGDLTVAGQTLIDYANNTYGHMVASMLLGRAPKSKELSDLMELSMVLLADHGPNVSGAVNTIISARAGKDLVSSLSSGLLTIGPRFGGAVNEAAAAWLKGVTSDIDPANFVEENARRGNHILGIGHKKYRVDHPDPRISALLKSQKKVGKYLKFAQGVEEITTAKQGNLILNVDGAIAAVFLDVLSEKEKMSPTKLQQLVDIEFFNALFVLARSVGFTAHFLDQKRIDEGLFRLRDDQIGFVERSDLR